MYGLFRSFAIKQEIITSCNIKMSQHAWLDCLVNHIPTVIIQVKPAGGKINSTVLFQHLFLHICHLSQCGLFI